MTVYSVIMFICSFDLSLRLGIGAIAMILCTSFKEAKSVAVPWLIISVVSLATLIWELIW